VVSALILYKNVVSGRKYAY